MLQELGVYLIREIKLTLYYLYAHIFQIDGPTLAYFSCCWGLKKGGISSPQNAEFSEVEPPTLGGLRSHVNQTEASPHC